ncbi:MAG: tail protein X [Rhodobacter sp.]|nr:tail protein X [Rhodobacter sp.]
MSVYVTKDGDVLDAICLAELGSTEHVAAVLDANPGLAAAGPVLPKGVEIDLPIVAAPAPQAPIRLWTRS